MREDDEASRRGSGPGKFRKGGSTGNSMEDQPPAAVQMPGTSSTMTPQLMAQYWQRMQQYFAMMQQQMAMNRGMGMGGMAMNPQMMQMMQAQQMQQQMMAAQGRGGGGGGPNMPMMMNPQMMQQAQQMMAQQQGNPGGGNGGGQVGPAAARASTPWSSRCSRSRSTRPSSSRAGAAAGTTSSSSTTTRAAAATAWAADRRRGRACMTTSPAQRQPGRRPGLPPQPRRRRPQPADAAGHGSAECAPGERADGPQECRTPGANYRGGGGGRGGNRGFHPYAR